MRRLICPVCETQPEPFVEGSGKVILKCKCTIVTQLHSVERFRRLEAEDF